MVSFGSRILPRTAFQSMLLFGMVLSVPALAQTNLLQIEKAKMNYASTKVFLETNRKDLAARYQASSSSTARQEILQNCRKLIEETLCNQIWPAWYGTPWSFNGSSKKPGEGSIACGTFVIFTLQDAGFHIPSKMARQPSENIIKNLTGTKGVKRFSRAHMDNLIEWVHQKGNGIYLVGLDCHVGFLIKKDDQLTFCHANYMTPAIVLNQEITSPSPLVSSNYRVFAKLFDDQMLKKWLKAEPFQMEYDYFRTVEK